MEKAITIKDLKKSFEDKEVLKGLSLEIPYGSTYGLIGPNGAGKTTLFRILVGISNASSGEAKILGKKAGDPEIKDSIGYMTQSEALYNDLTVKENIEFLGRLYGLNTTELKEATHYSLSLVQLLDRADSYVHTLSGGMKRRTSLACAIVHKPRLILLDEPTAGVDPELRAEFWEEFVNWGKQGTTLIITTHHLDEAHRCDTLGLIRSGEMLAEGKPGDLLEQSGASTIEEAFLTFARQGLPGEG